MQNIPTEKQLNEKVKLVEIVVKGSYWAQNDHSRRKKNYEITVLVPEVFNKSDIKRAVPKALEASEAYGDFLGMRTFVQSSEPKKTQKTIKRRELFSDRELQRFARLNEEAKKNMAAERSYMGDIQKGIAGDTSDYDPDTGLPPDIHAGPVVGMG